MHNIPVDSAVFRKRAMQCRHLAHGMSDKKSRDRLFSFASDYDRMAARTERSLNIVQTRTEGLARRPRRAGARFRVAATR
jgi:hypothetical protein